MKTGEWTVEKEKAYNLGKIRALNKLKDSIDNEIDDAQKKVLMLTDKK